MSLQAAPSDRIGAWVLGERLRRDRLGEVFRAEGPGGAAVRLRITPPAPDPERLTAVIARLGEVAGPGIAPVLDAMVDDSGHAAVATPPDVVDLDRRVRRRRLDAATLAALGAVLLDALARIHDRGLAHGAVSAAAVGIDIEGRPRWLDAGLAAGLRDAEAQSRSDAEADRAVDVARCAVMLRDLGRIPALLGAVLDPVAAGSPGAVTDAAALAAAWREAATGSGLQIPPPGSGAALAELLPPPPRRRRLPRPPRIALRPERRRQASIGVAALAVGFVAAAWLRGPGSPLGSVHDYLPGRAGITLTYRLTGMAAPVTLRVAQAGTVAGVYTVSLERVGAPAGASPLPLGLGGATLRDQDGSLVRTAPDGVVRDLVSPLTPGATWSDRRSGVAAGIVTTETRTLLGVASLVEPGGRFDDCGVVSLAAATTTSGGQGASGVGTAWFCPGIGLTRAVLRSPGVQELDIDLAAVH